MKLSQHRTDKRELLDLHYQLTENLKLIKSKQMELQTQASENRSSRAGTDRIAQGTDSLIVSDYLVSRVLFMKNRVQEVINKLFVCKELAIRGQQKVVSQTA